MRRYWAITMSESLRFLVVDDSRAVQAIVRRSLHSGDFRQAEIKFASDGEEALSLIEEWAPTLVLSDWHMPNMDGMRLLQTLRKHHPTQRFGFVTSEFERDKIELALEEGALFVVQKPFDQATLTEAVHKALKVTFIGRDDTVAAREETLMVMTINTHGLGEVMDSTFGSGVFKVDPLPDVDVDTIDLPSAVGVFIHEGTKEIRGLALIDHAGILLLGGSLARKPFAELEKLMMANAVPADIWVHAEKFLKEQASRMFLASDRGHFQLMKSQIIKHRPEQLVGIMKRSSTRSDFELTRATLLPGRISLIAK